MQYRAGGWLLTLFVAAAAAAAAPEPPAANAPTGRIAYTRLQDDSLVIYLADAAFRSDRPCPGMRARVQVHPALSRDGQRLAFSAPSVLDVGDWDVFTVGVDGSELKRVIPNATLPAWSPDGRQLLYTLTVSPPAIGIANGDGTRQRPLAPKLPLAVAPFWSPDGKRIGFSGSPRRDGKTADIYTMDPSGSDLQRITDGRRLYLAGAGAWSPDGNRLVVFAADPLTRKGEIQLWDVARKTSERLTDFGVPVDPNAVQLSATNALRLACWSPDGSSVLATLGTIVGGRGELGLYQIPLEGGPRRRLSPESVNCLMGSWSK
jgi:Tol biopolymer transport system component